jgi:hypothetical protein
MRTYAISFVSLLTCIAIVTTALHSEEPEVPAPANSLDCALYTKPYKATEHGAFFLPAGVKWKVMPRYIGRSNDGRQIVDDRITLVLQDTKNSFWPMIAKMSLEEAERLQKELSAIISDKKKATAEAK